MSKLSLSISLDKPAVEALDELKTILERRAKDTLPENVSMPVQYSRSTVIQMCIMAYCQTWGVNVKWKENE